MIRTSTIGIEKVRRLQNTYDIKNGLFHLLDLMKEKHKIIIPPKAKVFIKPNICYMKGCETGTTVDPYMVKCLVDWLRSNFDLGMITIGEADATSLDVDIAFRVLGWHTVFDNLEGIRLLNISKDERITIQLNGLYFNKIVMSKIYMSSDYLISFGKLKIHYPAGISCILKNQFGAYPEKYKAKFHKKLNDVIYDLNKVRIPNLCIVDGIIGMEGDGPVSGMPKPLGIIVAGDDPVATDCACAEIMGMNPSRINYLRQAIKKGLGNPEYEIIGESMEAVKTKFKYGKPISRKAIKGLADLTKVLVTAWPGEPEHDT